jgi:hypothetical protein
MKTKLLALMLLAGGSMFAETRFSVGVNVGGFGAAYSQSAPPYGYQIPPCPGPDYSFVDGYWAQDRGQRHWVGGFWQRRPIVANRYYNSGFRNSGRDRDRHDFDRDRGSGSRNGFRNR